MRYRVLVGHNLGLRSGGSAPGHGGRLAAHRFDPVAQGVSGTPLPGNDDHGDYTAQHHQLGADFVRTHDIDCSGTGDIDGIGANRIFSDWSADPNDPASYNFGPTDQAILSAVRAGEQIEFNLGHSDLSCAGLGFNNTPPPDPALYAQVARRVAQHYNDGWAAGYHLHIRYWEIWNEPDLIPFWSGTREQFYALYDATARALKSLHPWMLIGGPALTTNNDLTGFRESLLAYIRAHDLPLDFWTIHHYSDFTEDPLDFNRLADISRSLLDSYGFTGTEIHLNEWNYGIAEQPSETQRAAYIASSLTTCRTRSSRAPCSIAPTRTGSSASLLPTVRSPRAATRSRPSAR